MRIALFGVEALTVRGGLTWSQHRIAHLLRAAGYDVHLIRLAATTTQAEWQANTATVREVEGFDLPAFEITPWWCPPDTTYACHEVVEGLKQLDDRCHYDVFHCLGLKHSSYLVAHAVPDKPLILSGRGSDINRDQLQLKQLAALQWMLRRASWLTFASSEMLERAHRLEPCRDRATVILNSTAEDFFIPGPPPFEPTPGITTIGTIGSPSLKKGTDVLIRALQLLKAQGCTPDVYWVGHNTYQDETTGRLAPVFAEWAASGRIRFSGMLPHTAMLNHLRMMDVFVLPSLDEGCPNALLEAMLARRAIVASAVGAVPDLIRHDREGLLVPPYDAEALAQSIAALLHDPDRRARLAAAAYQRVTTFCTAEQETRRWLGVYDRILHPHAQPAGTIRPSNGSRGTS